MADITKPAVSFGFSKKVETKKLSKSVAGENVDDGKVQTDFVLSLEENEVKSSVPKQKEKGPYVIPLIKKNRWREETEVRGPDVAKDFDPNNLDQQAAKELLEESAKYQECWENGDKPDPNLAIPLLMQNKIPQGYETDDKLDVSLRPDDPDDADYEQIPIEHFGFAMLRGMGWKEGQGIGKNGKVIAPVEAHLRPKGLGLGADRSQASDAKDKKRDKTIDEESECLELKKGAHCVILNGKHKDLYGLVEGIDEDNARLVIKLSLNSKSVTLTQYSVRVVGRKEYEKYSKYLNKGKAEKYKQEEAQQNGQGKHSDLDSDSYKSESRSYRPKYDGDKPRHKEQESSKKRKSNSNESGSSKHHRSEPSSKSRSADNSSFSWLQPHLRVRIIDKHFKKGRYYKEKVIVVDVISLDSAVCKTDDGKVLEGLSHSQLETVIPKTDAAIVMLCAGKYKGKLAKIIKRDRDSCSALIQLIDCDRDHVLQVDFDEICDYVGAVDDFD